MSCGSVLDFFKLVDVHFTSSLPPRFDASEQSPMRVGISVAGREKESSLAASFSQEDNINTNTKHSIYICERRK